MAKVKIELSNSCEEFEWESKLDELHYHMLGFEGFTGHWLVEGSNLGWRNRTGWKEFEAETAEELLNEILPNTDWTIQIEIDTIAEEIEIVAYHHDSPTGEFYKITVLTEDEYDEYYY